MTTMRPLFEGTFYFAGFHGSKAHCWLRIFDGDPDRPTVVIATELRTNTGTSITNAAETLAAAVCRRHRIDPDSLLWVEHYGPSPALRLPERYSLVSFDRNGRERPEGLGQPRWSPTSKERVEALVGSKLGGVPNGPVE
jgi:hypothetical protein